MNNINIKKYIVPNIPYFVVGLFGTKVGQAYRLTPGIGFSEKILKIVEGFALAFKTLAPSFVMFDIVIGIIIGAGLKLAVYLKGKNAKKFRKNEEYGSARWGTSEDIRPFVDPVFKNNVILTQTESLMMSNRPKNPKDARNKNVLIIGGSGSGKTRFWIKPNLMQLHSSYIVTDPKGTLVLETGKLFYDSKEYEVKVFNTINTTKSMHYNPFHYIHSEKDILKLVDVLITNTKGEGKSSDPFWEKAETLLYCALIGYIWYEADEDEKNFAMLIDLLNSFEVHEEDDTFKNAIDYLFDDLEQECPTHFAVRQYRKFKLAAGNIKYR